MKRIIHRVISFICALCLLCSGWERGLFPALQGRILAAPASRTVILNATDGSRYRITVSYDTDSGIPEDALLRVTEIREGEAGYGRYLSRSAHALGAALERFSLARAFDIALLDPATGQEYQPETSVTVGIRLLDAALDENAGVSVLHFGDEVEKMDCVWKGETLEFETEGFSVYLVVNLEPAFSAVLQADDLEEGSPYYLFNPRGGTQYIKAEITDNGLAKSTSISEAGLFYFEEAGSENQYKIYSLDSDVKKYYYFNTSDGKVGLASAATGANWTDTVELEFKDNTVYIKWGTNYRLNKNSEFNGSKFSGWTGQDDGSKITIVKTTSYVDPLGIDGKTYLLVYNESQAMTAERTPSGKTAGLVSTPVSKTANGCYYTEGEVLPRWTFTSAGDGTYYISAYSVDDNTQVKYLHIDAPGKDNQDVSVTLSDTPQGFTLYCNNGQLTIFTEKNKTRLQYNNSRFGARHNNSAPGDSEKFTLGEWKTGMVVYEYVKGKAPGDPGRNTTLPLGVSEAWQEGYTVSGAVPNTYNSYGESIWTYTLDHWKDEDGTEYWTGDSLELQEEMTILQPVWNYSVSDRTVSVVYNRGDYAVSSLPPGESVVFSESSPYYFLKDMPEASRWYYNASDGKKYRFSGWKTDGGQVFPAGEIISLADTSLYSGSYETLTLTAQWSRETDDPWGLENQPWVIVNSQSQVFAVSATPADPNGLHGLAKEAAAYRSDDNTALRTEGEENPTLWYFESLEDGTYYLRSGESYLNLIANNNAALSDTPQPILVEYRQSDNRYFLSQGGVYLDYFATNNQIFSAYKSSYSGTNANKKFILASPGRGMIYYSYPLSASGDGDSAENANDLTAVRQGEVWAEGHTAPEPSQSVYRSYSPTEVWEYTFSHWHDSAEPDPEKGNYVPGYPIGTAPETSLELEAVWTCEKKHRSVRIHYEYANGGHESLPLADQTITLSDSIAAQYIVKAPEDNDLTYLSEAEGKLHRFVGTWTTGSGKVFAPGDLLDLTDLSNYKPGQYDQLTLKATFWTSSFPDPWNIAGTAHTIVYHRPDLAENNYLAATPGSEEARLEQKPVKYYDTLNTSISTDDLWPGVWQFQPLKNGSYYIYETVTGTYLNLGSGERLTTGPEPQEIELLFSQQNARYSLRAYEDGKSLLLNYHNSGYFRTQQKEFSAAGSNERFILARFRGNVLYSYPASETDVEGTPVFLPVNHADLWEDPYTAKAPAQSTYVSRSDDYQWTYRFSHWVDPEGGRVDIGDPVTVEPQPSLLLRSVWTLENKEALTRTIRYTVIRHSSDTQSPSLPGVDGLVMTSGTADKGNTAQELVTGKAAEAYTVRSLTRDYYVSVKGKKYQFTGWRLDENTSVQAGAEVDLIAEKATYDPDNDRNISLVSQWTDEFTDPWGIADGNGYLLVYVKDSEHRGVSSQAKTNDTALDRIFLTPWSGLNVYTPKNSGEELTFWYFEALTDGAYYVYTLINGERRYLNMTTEKGSDDNADISLSETQQKIWIFSLNGRYAFSSLPSGSKIPFLDFYNDSQGFSAWWKDTPSNNNLFYLGIPAENTIVYRYPASPVAEDTGTYNNLPADTAQYVTVTVAQPVQSGYYSQNFETGVQWNYVFTGWKDKNSDRIYQPGDSIEESSTPVELEAVWSFAGKTDIERTVRYDLNLPGPVRVLPHIVGRPSNNEETVSRMDATSYSIRDLEQATIRVLVDNGASKDDVYEFLGWTTEDASAGTILPNSAINTILREANGKNRYDANDDGVVDLKAVWNANYGNGSRRRVMFYVSLDSISDDIFNERIEISSNAVDFTTEVFYSIMNDSTGNALHPDTTKPMGDGTTAYPLIYYFYGTNQLGNTCDLSIADADFLIRSLGNGGYTDETNHVSYRVADFPSDQEVLASIRQMADVANTGYGGTKKIRLDGKLIDINTLTPENYTIRWYVCKYHNDGWHIDGKLTPKVTYLSISKTFAGEEEALAHIPNDFYIGVVRSDLVGTVTPSPYTSERGVYSLVLEDRTRGEKTDYGFIRGYMTGGSFGYTEKRGDTYYWTFPVAKGTEYSISEYNFFITVDSITYGLAAQYSILNPQTGVDAANKVKWFGHSIIGYAASYERTAIQTDTIQTTALFNTYVETGTLVIQKQETSGAVMSDVEFKVYDITSGQEEPVLLTRKTTARINDGKYTMLLGEGARSYSAFTSENGDIYLTFARPSIGSGESAYRYRIEEIVPLGYEQGTENPSFIVSVDEYGFFTFDEEHIVKPHKGDISMSEFVDLEKGTQAMTVTVTNEPKFIRATVTKEWEPGVDTESYVTVSLRGTEGKRIVGDYADVVLNEDNGWTYTWDRVPLVYGNKPIEYSALEKTIGPYRAGTSAYNLWEPEIVTEYYDGDGHKLSPSAPAASRNEARITVTNNERDKEALTVALVKEDGGSHKRLYTAEFRVYKEFTAAEGSEVPEEAVQITFGSSPVTVVPKTAIVSEPGALLRIKFGETVYLQEVSAPDGYVPLEGYIQLAVSEDGKTVTLHSEEDGAAAYKKDASDERKGTLTIKNEMAALAVSFRKTDGFGNPPDTAAEFTLFTSYDAARARSTAEADVKKVIVNDLEVSTASSATGNAPGVTKGEVSFLVSKGIYYMAETRAPAGCEENPAVYLLLVGEEALDRSKWASGGILSGITEAQLQAQTGSGAQAVDYAVFRVDSDTGKAAATPDIAACGILNESSASRQVILRKTDDSGASYQMLRDAEFHIFRMDLTELENRKAYNSFSSGIWFSGVLPYGQYYLVETKAPTSPEGYSGNAGNVYRLVVSDSVTIDRIGNMVTDDGRDAQVSEDGGSILSEFKEWFVETYRSP